MKLSKKPSPELNLSAFLAGGDRLLSCRLLRHCSGRRPGGCIFPAGTHQLLDIGPLVSLDLLKPTARISHRIKLCAGMGRTGPGGSPLIGAPTCKLMIFRQYQSQTFRQRDFQFTR